MNTIRFSKWLEQVEDKLKTEFDGTVIEEAYQKYIDGWTVDEFAFEICESLEANKDYALGRGH